MNISIKNGSFQYKNSRKILDNIEFTASSGDAVAILGPNGAGKTTLLRCLMGFLKWNSGDSYIDGTPVSNISSHELWQKISYVPQAKNVSSGFTAKEMVLLGRSSHIGIFSQPSEEDQKIAEELLCELHIDYLADKKCDQISGGELQMVLIARAMAAKPSVLILDEPESNLDFKNQLIVLNTMTKLTNEGIICIFNTHYPAHALQRANKSLILSKEGKYIFGETHKVVTEENIEKAFGVKAAIGEIETDGNMIKNVIPISVSKSDESFVQKEAENSRCIAAATIITDNFGMSEKINEQLHNYNQYLIGRMGMPYPSCNLYIINITLDAPKHIVEELTEKLNLLQDVSSKITYAKGDFDEQ